jgi:hypothetical protein
LGVVGDDPTPEKNLRSGNLRDALVEELKIGMNGGVL